MSKGYLLDTNIAIAILINESNVIEFELKTPMPLLLRQRRFMSLR
jgi:predicted nucleic acid-binding protein